MWVQDATAAWLGGGGTEGGGGGVRRVYFRVRMVSSRENAARFREESARRGHEIKDHQSIRFMHLPVPTRRNAHNVLEVLHRSTRIMMLYLAR